MKQTSLEAYIKFNDNQAFTGQRGLLLFILRQQQPLSYLQLAGLSGLSINAVCGRMNELKDMMLIESVGTRINELSGVKNKIYMIKHLLQTNTSL